MAIRNKVKIYKGNEIDVPFELTKNSIIEMISQVALTDVEISEISHEIENICKERESVLSNIEILSENPNERFNQTIDYIYYLFNSEGIADSNYASYYHLTSELMKLLPSFYDEFGNDTDIKQICYKDIKSSTDEELYELYTIYLYRLWLARIPRKSTFSKTYGFILQLFSIIREINYRHLG